MLKYNCFYYYLLIVKIITLCFKVPAKVNASCARVREQKYYLETFDTEILCKALSLAHSFARQNDNNTDILADPSKICDFKDCIVKNPDPQLQSFFLASTLSTFQATTRPTMSRWYSSTTTRNEESVSIFQLKPT